MRTPYLATYIGIFILLLALYPIFKILLSFIIMLAVNHTIKITIEELDKMCYLLYKLIDETYDTYEEYFERHQELEDKLNSLENDLDELCRSIYDENEKYKDNKVKVSDILNSKEVDTTLSDELKDIHAKYVELSEKITKFPKEVYDFIASHEGFYDSEDWDDIEVYQDLNDEDDDEYVVISTNNYTSDYYEDEDIDPRFDTAIFVPEKSKDKDDEIKHHKKSKHYKKYEIHTATPEMNCEFYIETINNDPDSTEILSLSDREIKNAIDAMYESDLIENNEWYCIYKEGKYIKMLKDVYDDEDDDDDDYIEDED